MKKELEKIYKELNELSDRIDKLSAETAGADVGLLIRVKKLEEKFKKEFE